MATGFVRQHAPPATLANIAVGSQDSVADPVDAWIDGEVLAINGDEVMVNCTSGKTTIK
ncbi:hypothetical protein KSP39_PZI007424 [Platanthera zijinensis]|uniref:Myosin N-terminal SH3-like domain-containing protein n=1 Tax=Platanthera zijinensis TaxID=2320716 RepID=A0AAP0BQF0_9ASPA